MNNIKVKVFGRLSEDLKSKELELAYSGNVLDFKTNLIAMFPQLANIKFAIAVNHSIASESDIIPKDAVLALLPPYSGG